MSATSGRARGVPPTVHPGQEATSTPNARHPMRAPPGPAELLDHPTADDASVRESLRNIARANWWFGGHAAVRHGVHALLPGGLRSVTLLDVGTGLGDVPAMLRRWLAGRGVALRAVGLERHPVAARTAHAAGLPAIVACGGALPCRDHGVDLVIASQVLHHFDRASAVRFLQECTRAARVGVVIADLHPTPLAGLGFRIAGHALRFDPITIQDGVTSLARGYTPRQLDALLHEAFPRRGPEPIRQGDPRGAGPWTITRRPGARIVAWWRTSP